MILTKWGFTRRNSVKAEFDLFPHSLVIFRKIKFFYFVYQVHWSSLDPIVETRHLEEMELLVNKEFGYERYYLNRRNM